jgi:hypothetical protein
MLPGFAKDILLRPLLPCFVDSPAMPDMKRGRNFRRSP